MSQYNSIKSWNGQDFCHDNDKVHINFYIRKRFILVIMLCIGSALGYALRISISVAIVNATANRTQINSTTDELYCWSHFDWDVDIQGYIISASAVGTAIFQIPTACLTRITGGKLLFSIMIFGLSTAALFTALAACWSEYALMAIRFIHGCIETTLYPATIILISNWVPAPEKSKLVTCSIIGQDIGLVAGNILSGVISSSIGWPFIYYILGGSGILFGMLWLYLISEDPASHPSISKHELDYINSNAILQDHSQKKYKDLPWKDMVTSLPLWSMLIAMLSLNITFQAWSADMPLLFNDALQMDIMDNGFISAIPHICAGVSTLVAGWLSDLLCTKYNVSANLLRKLYISLSLVLEALVFFVCSFIIHSRLLILCLLLAFISHGFIWSGILTNNLDLSPDYSGLVAGSLCFFGALGGMLGPSVYGIILSKGGVQQWKIVFNVNAVICLIGGILYAVFGSGEDQQWGKKSSKANS